MKLFLTVSLLCTSGLSLASIFFVYKHLTTVGCHGNSSQATPPKATTLVMCTTTGNGGGEIHALNLYKTLLEQNKPTTILVAHNGGLRTFLEKEHLPFYSCNIFRISLGGYRFMPGLNAGLQEIRKNNDIKTILCNDRREINFAKDVFPQATVLYTHHTVEAPPLRDVKRADGVMPVLPTLTLAHPRTTFIPPFFDIKKFTDFKSEETKEEFFKKEFNITLKKDIPIICMIAHFYQDNDRKNHPLVFKAIHELVYKKNKPVNVMLIGDGDIRDKYKAIVKELNLEDSIHFLGFADKTPAVLYYSDINILPSKREAFGIAALEGALMGKPTIVSNTVGAANRVIIHNQTGLIFENDNCEDLVEKILVLLNNPSLAKKIGEQAHVHVLKNYDNKAKLTQILEFGKSVRASC